MIRCLLFIACVTMSGCSGDAPAIPNVADPSCTWAEHKVVTAPDNGCLRIGSRDGGRFRSDSHDECSGVECLDLGPGRSATLIGALGEYVTVYQVEIECDLSLPPACEAEPG